MNWECVQDVRGSEGPWWLLVFGCGCCWRSLLNICRLCFFIIFFFNVAQRESGAMPDGSPPRWQEMKKLALGVGAWKWRGRSITPESIGDRIRSHRTHSHLNLKAGSHCAVCPFWGLGREHAASVWQLWCCGCVRVVFSLRPEDTKSCWCRRAGHLYRYPGLLLVFLCFVSPLVLVPDDDVTSVKKKIVKLVCDDGHVSSGLFQAVGRVFLFKRCQEQANAYRTNVWTVTFTWWTQRNMLA